MTEIDEYAFVFFFRTYRKSLSMPQGFVRYGDVVTAIEDNLRVALNEMDGTSIIDTKAVSEQILVSLAQANAIVERKDKFAGLYYRYLDENYPTSRSNVLNSSPISAMSVEIGERFFPDVFSGYKNENPAQLEKFSGIDFIPASDRIVTLNHNQQAEIEEASSALIDAVAVENSIDGDVELRSRVLGQIKAGRELVRAQTFKAYLLYSSVMTILGGLIEKYRGQAIGIAATKLLELLIESVFKS